MLFDGSRVFLVQVLDAIDRIKQKYLVPCRNTYNVVVLDEFDRGLHDKTS